ncbi:carboxypeptidase-like regulatory domain-containing protein [Lutimonas saemankumensis]|uniref:carboxypeptidase-like regulatory domain-containing protein n=1 Tax=Lutimonas saemankumensis TaxID=483016 RepID=UPI001CD63A20|nr:carboxypeptidase-like regulatory domain-containing protein [Lutimonas saemankumensis]MCA0931099.1 carboxypeptidase-like regulatory domain-containing protein [Lutimonas saemankumensis]
MNRATLLFFFLFWSLAHGQENRQIISGKVLNDTIPLENVHIINKNSRKGTISNRLGHFKISVAVNDTLIISDIQFEKRIILVNQGHILEKFILINLYELTNELDEVIVRQYEDMSEELGLPNAGKKPLNKLERNLNHYSQKSTAVVILQALLFKPGGIDDVYNIVSGNRKRDRKLKALIEQDEQNARNISFSKKLREQFQDDFFINSVKIEKEHIIPYINFCIPMGIINLYDKGRMIEVIDILLKNKDPYYESLNTIDEY